MKERPILFSGPMVRALLAGTKTQTRRAVKIPPEIHEQGDNDATCIAWLPEHEGGPGFYGWMTEYPEEGSSPIRCPCGQPGDRLIVREAWQYYDWSEYGEPTIRYAADNATAQPSVPEEWCDRTQDAWAALSDPANYEIDNRARDRKWRPSIHMPRWASRLTIEITAVRVERLQDISKADATAEGLDFVADGAAAHGIKGLATSWSNDPRKSYRALWESINGPGSWNANPWVWVVEFKRVIP